MFWVMRFLTTLFIVKVELSACEDFSRKSYKCVQVSDHSTCYFKPKNSNLSWNMAYQICKDMKSTLPVITNQEEQGELENYLRSIGIASIIWTAGRKVQETRWKWINGAMFQLKVHIDKSDREDATHVSIQQDFTLNAQDPRHRVYCICQYPGNVCDSSNYTKFSNGCFEASDDDATWYESRNRCLRKGGDLMVLRDQEEFDKLTTLLKLGTKSYWIGLIKYSWIWQSNETGGPEVKYSRWNTQQPEHSTTDSCISVNGSTGNWTSEYCNSERDYICQIYAADARTTTRDPEGDVITTHSINGFVETLPYLAIAIVIIVVCIALAIVVKRILRNPHACVRLIVQLRTSSEPKKEAAIDSTYEGLQQTSHVERNATLDEIYTELHQWQQTQQSDYEEFPEI